MVLRNISSIEGKQHYSVHDQDYILLVHLVIQWNLSMQEFQGYPITVVHIESSASSQTPQSSRTNGKERIQKQDQRAAILQGGKEWDNPIKLHH